MNRVSPCTVPSAVLNGIVAVGKVHLRVPALASIACVQPSFIVDTESRPQLALMMFGPADQSGSASSANGTGWNFQTTAPVARLSRSMLRPLFGAGSGTPIRRVLPVVA